mgnify:FL=1
MRLVGGLGVSIAQAARDLDAHENLLSTWVEQLADDPLEVFPGHAKMKAAATEIAHLKREVQKLKSERDNPKGATA